MLADQLRKPGLLSQFQHRTKPAADTRFRSSNTADPTVNVYDDCTGNAFSNSGQHDINTRILQFRRRFRGLHADQTTGPSTDPG